MPSAVQVTLFVGATLLVSVVRRRLGGGRTHNAIMFGGTISGLLIGAALATALARVFHPRDVDLLSICLFAGILIGWAIAWPIARRVSAPHKQGAS